jgi:hypothetical protein
LEKALQGKLSGKAPEKSQNPKNPKQSESLHIIFLIN